MERKGFVCERKSQGNKKERLFTSRAQAGSFLTVDGSHFFGFIREFYASLMEWCQAAPRAEE